MIDLQDVLSVLKKHMKNIIVFFVLINIIAFSSFSIVFDSHVKYIDRQITNNIIEYGEIDREQLCKIVGCQKVIDLNKKKCLSPDKKGHLKVVKYEEVKFTELTEIFYLINSRLFTIYNKTSDLYFIMDIRDMFDDYKKMAMILIPLLLLIYLIPLYSSIKREKEESIILNAGSEALLANKSMINITENIHHELNTPLEVIDNKIEKIHGEFIKFLETEMYITDKICTIPEDRLARHDKLRKLNEDFDFIKTSSEQIYAVLEKMKGFKHLRYSNGNKTIKNIIDGGFKIINISNTNFEYKVDNKLKEYKIGTKDLKNADFLSIILNHLKNSLEANSSKIYILFGKFENGKLYMRIIDNGNGIPNNVKKKIFAPNFSTKNSDSGIRGNGMYLNKHILTQVGGNIELISSSEKGTTIELEIPAIKK